MTIVVHDFSGHPFQAELSRRLAGLGHDVEHHTAKQYVSGKGHLDRQPGDGRNLTFATTELVLPFMKYSPWARLRWEIAYGRTWMRRLREQRPEAVVACNLPLFSLWVFARHARRTGLPWVLWHQDIYSFGLSDELRRRFPRPLAVLGSKILRRLEARIVGSAGHVVAIGDAFTEVYRAWDIEPGNVSVIPNWAPLDSIFPVGRTNRRSELLFPEKPAFRMVYAGTLGRKHNPLLLPDLVDRLVDSGLDVGLAVVSEGQGADDIAASSAAAAGHVEVFGFQSADHLPDVLGSADVLIALLEPDATKFSIPSKVLSYMAAGRPIVGLMPSDNPAAKDIAASGGLVVTPDEAGVVEATAWLADLARDPARRDRIGEQTRLLAERQFDADRVAHRFEAIIEQVTARRD